MGAHGTNLAAFHSYLYLFLYLVNPHSASYTTQDSLLIQTVSCSVPCPSPQTKNPILRLTSFLWYCDPRSLWLSKERERDGEVTTRSDPKMKNLQLPPTYNSRGGHSAYTAPTQFLIGTHRTDRPLVNIPEIKGLLALLRMFAELKNEVGGVGPHSAPYIPTETEKRWSWFVGLWNGMLYF
jgi:hypothetical protein